MNFRYESNSAPHQSLRPTQWDYTKPDDVDSSLPALFQGRLFVHLSRFCRTRYCIAQHATALMNGISGDVGPHTTEQTFALLKKPTANASSLNAALSRLEAYPGPAPIPPPESRAEVDLFDALTELFVAPARAQRARDAICHATGNAVFGTLTALLGHIRAAHFWSESHPETPLEPHVQALLDNNAELAALLQDLSDMAPSTDTEIDVAKLRASEQRLRTLADAIPQLVWTNDGLGVANDFNKRWYDYSGLTFEESVGRGWQAIVHPDDATETARRWQKALDEGDTFETEYRLRGADGNYHWFIGRNVPLKDAEGIVQGWFGSATEIEELKRAQQLAHESEARYRDLAGDLSRTKEALLAADRQKDQFIATLAHELRNPLAPVRSAMQLISMSGSQDPAVLWALDVVNRQTHSMARLIDDLMDVSRISQNKLMLRTERVELATVLRDAMDICRPLLVQQEHTLTVQMPTETAMLDGDGTRLAQVFANLLDNAVKYTEAGGTILLTARVEGADVEVRVRDSGIGIAPNNVTHIFGLFSQVRTPKDRAKGGLGIGLALVKQLVELHGGDITVNSEGEGFGSEFIVRLPIATVERRKNPERELLNPEFSFSGVRILVVDDNVDAADAFDVLFTRQGSLVRSVYDGARALAAAEEFLPDIILMDIGLPKLSGHEVAERIRGSSWGQHIILVAISGWGNEEEKRKSYAAGFDRHLVKPVEPGRLMRVMAELLTH